MAWSEQSGGTSAGLASAGVEVRESAADAHATTGILVLTFLLTGDVPAEFWGGAEAGD